MKLKFLIFVVLLLPYTSQASAQVLPAGVLPAQWSRGDGYGGSEDRIGVFANKEICYAQCSTWRKNGQFANGATVDSKTKRICFCEYGQKGRNNNGYWINTFIERGCKEDENRTTTVELLLRSHLKLGWYAEFSTESTTKRFRRGLTPIDKIIFNRMRWHLQGMPSKVFNSVIPKETRLDQSIDLSSFKGMRLKDICHMLQGYLQIAESREYTTTRKGTKFKLNIGGTESSFRLAKAPRGTNQLLYWPETGRAPPYNNIYKVIGDAALSNEQQKSLGGFMLDTYQKDFSTQPIFEDVDFLRNNKELQRAVQEFILIPTIAEAVPPEPDLIKYLLENDIVSHLKSTKDFKLSGRSIGEDIHWEYLLESYVASGEDKTIEIAFRNMQSQYQKGTQKARIFFDENRKKLKVPEEFDSFILPTIDPSTMEDSHASESLATEFLSEKQTPEENIVKTSQNIEELTTDVRSKEDVRYLKDKIEEDVKNQCSKKRRRRKRRSVCKLMGKGILDEDSINLEGSKLSYEFKDPNDQEKNYKFTTEIDENRLFTKKRMQSQKSASKAYETFTKSFAGYGLAMSIFGSIGSFEEGNTVQGSIQAVQSLHSIGALTGLNEKLARISTKALSKVVIKGAEKVGLKVGEKALAKLSALAVDIPIVGIAFDVYFIANDISDLSDAIKKGNTDEIVLSSTHLFLDETTLVLSLMGPETEPLVIALSLIRMAVDDFYIDISTEMKKAHGALGKTLAFFKGIGEGFADFLSGGMLRALKDLKAKEKYDRDLLSDLSTPESYYEIKGSNCDGLPSTIDFTSGKYWGLGGEIKFILGDDDSFIVELSGVPADGEEKQTIRKRFVCRGLNDIILGIGESKNAKWKKETAKLWFFIPVKSAKVIDKLEDNSESLYGSYTGNNKNNSFYAVQGNVSKDSNSECKVLDSSDELNIRVTNYHYVLNGMAGNDTFFLGPQMSNVKGGDGHDVYRLMSTGGKTIIDNFALDKLNDALLLNVSQSHVVCKRKQNDLVITYCGTHLVIVKEFFYPVENEFRRHLTISTNDGIQMRVIDAGISSKGNEHLVDCIPYIIDKRGYSDGQMLDLSKQPFTKVVTVMGSNGDDVIVGNELANFVDGGAGNDRISGAEGEDTYILRRGSGCDVINNYADDLSSDKVLLPVSYGDIKLARSKKTNLKLSCSKTKGSTEQFCVIIENWFSGKKYQHMTFVSADHVVFQVKELDGAPKKKPFMMDYSTSKKGIVLDLKTENSLLQSVITVADSFYPDRIYGNDAGNFISTNGLDFVQGNGGSDVYRVLESCTNSVINNYAKDEKQDIMFVDGRAADMRLLQGNSQSLKLSIESKIIVTLLHWFQGKEYRHLLIRTSDGITAELPENVTEMVKWKNKLKAVEISLDQEECNYAIKAYNLMEERYKAVKRFTSLSDKCSYKVIGNDENNYIDPGAGSPYGKQFLKGGKGADVYVIGYNYGEYNEIDNYADDEDIDTLILHIGFKYINVKIRENSIVLSSKLRDANTSVIIKDFLLGKKYNHILVKTSDNVLCKLSAEIPHIIPLIVDYRGVMHSQILNMSKSFPGARVSYGSTQKSNYIYGSKSTLKISAGHSDDVIIGGESGETIEGYSGNDRLVGNGGNDVINGGDGDDIISGNEGNDVIFGGRGADRIEGGKGMDTVIFVGDILKAEGVSISLKHGYGKGSDAEGDAYSSIESVIGSEFDDVIESNDCDNILSGKSGNDSITTYGGTDVLVGGDGRDLYNLTDATGWKFINNHAYDNETDVVLLGDAKGKLCFYSFGKDLYFHYEMTKQRPLDVKLKGWYKGKGENQHLSIRFANEKFLSKYNMLNSLSKAKATKSTDRIWSLFKRQAKVTVIGYGWNTIFVRVQVGLLARIREKTLINMQLNYVSEGAEMKSLQVSRSTFKLIRYVPSGVATTISLSLHRCSHVLASTTPLIVRTKPNSPTNPRVLFASAVSITVGWTPPSAITDPNRDYYHFKCIAYSGKEVAFQAITKENSTSCLFDRLVPNTNYVLKVYSVAGAEQSAGNAELKASTLSICANLKEPSNGEIREEGVKNGQGFATLSCDAGFELTAVDPQGKRLLKLAQTITVPCNSTLPCWTWSDSKCYASVRCMKVPCSEQPLKNNRLVYSHSGSAQFLHGDRLSVSCKHGYSFKGSNGPRQSIICNNGQWSALPECRLLHNCTIPIPSNGAVVGLFLPRVSPSSWMLRHGQEIKYRCQHGYQLSGANSVKCQDGKPIFKPAISPSCTLVSCPYIPPLANGRVLASRRGRPLHGTIYSFRCNVGYYLTGPIQKTCNGGSWYPSTRTKCNPKACTSTTVQRCYNGGRCINIGNNDYRCACKSEWSGRQCTSRRVIESILDAELKKSLSQNGGTGHNAYTALLFRFLSGRYPDYNWYVSSYPPRRGWDRHAMVGWYLKYFETHNRNLVVAYAKKGSPWKIDKRRLMGQTQNFVRNKGCSFKSLVSQLFNTARQQWKVPLKIVHIIRGYHSTMIQGGNGFKVSFRCGSSGWWATKRSVYAYVALF